MKSMCQDTRATDSIIKSGQKDTEASIKYLIEVGGVLKFWTNFVYILLQVNDGIGIMDLSVMQSYFAMILCGLYSCLVK